MPRLSLVLATLLLTTATAQAASVDVPGGLSLKVDDATGGYELIAKDVGWTFAGKVGSPLTKVAARDIQDGVGAGQEISFEYAEGEMPLKGSIRVYAGRPVAVFSVIVPIASAKAPTMFPSFTTLPANLHPFSHRESVFAGPNFALSPQGMPWVMFDDSAKTWILSPASHFLAARMDGDGKTLAASGLNPAIQSIPAGTEQRTLLAVDAGINKTWETWGHALTDLQGKKRPANDADAGLKYFGYWTDNGATYYYNYDQNLGYAGTIQAVADHYKQSNIPLGYMQLDSWWYSKTLDDSRGRPGQPKSRTLPEGEWNRYGGLLEWKAHPFLFPDGLAAFQKRLGLPLIAHNRWIDRNSPYHQKYKISGVAAVDPKYWDEIAAYLKSSGGITYEQDWLIDIQNNSPETATTVDQGDAFMDNMARACKEQGLTMQYCMELPCHFLQGSKYDNLTSTRVSNDGFSRNKWMPFLFTSRLSSALGEWPWVDVFRSTDRENLLLADLSAGMVGVGDAIGRENRANIMMAIRADGVIVKPDASLTPTDDTYCAFAANKRDLVIGSTYTDHAAGRTAYVFAYSQSLAVGTPVTFTLASLGIKGAAYVWDEETTTGTPVADGGTFTGKIGQRGFSYYVVAPVVAGGVALVGDGGKFVSMGKQRIASVKSDADHLTTDLVLAPGDEPVTLHGFADAAPGVSVTNASAGPITFDSATKHFTVTITPVGDLRSETHISVTINPGK